MLRVAEMAAQVTAAEAHENSGRTTMEAFPLEGVEYFVYFVHRLRDFGTSRLRDNDSQSRSLAVSRLFIQSFAERRP